MKERFTIPVSELFDTPLEGYMPHSDTPAIDAIVKYIDTVAFEVIANLSGVPRADLKLDANPLVAAARKEPYDTLAKISQECSDMLSERILPNDG